MTVKLIRSRDNPQYKQLQKLAQERVSGHCLLEGIHLCQEWLKHQGPPLQAVFDHARLDDNPELSNLARGLKDTAIMALEPSLFARLSAVPSNQGVFFSVVVPKPALPQPIVQSSLWLDRVQDPGNVGSILRTAAAAGISDVYLSSGCARAWSQKVLRSAQGAHFSLRLFEDLDLLALHPQIKLPLLVTSLRQAQSLYADALPPACIWLFGHEGQGVDAQLEALADRRVFIPQSTAVESLNVGAAVAVCLFEQKRQALIGNSQAG